MKPLPILMMAACAGVLSVVTGCANFSFAKLKTEKTVDDQATIFRRMDANRDGKVSRAEFNAGFADAILTVYNQPPKTGSVTADQWNGIERAGKGSFAALDHNKDGKLTHDELSAGKDRDAAVNRIFDRIDKNHDGVISPEEGRPSGLDRTPQQRAEGTGL